MSDSLDRRSPSEPLCRTSLFYYIMDQRKCFPSHPPGVRVQTNLRASFLGSAAGRLTLDRAHLPRLALSLTRLVIIALAKLLPLQLGEPPNSPHHNDETPHSQNPLLLLHHSALIADVLILRISSLSITLCLSPEHHIPKYKIRTISYPYHDLGVGGSTDAQPPPMLPSAHATGMLY
jgi:hypothetical protein